MKQIITILVALILFSGCSKKSGDAQSEDQAKIDSVKIDSLVNIIAVLKSDQGSAAQNLAEFDTLDFKVFNKEQWTRLHESHSKDIKVYWPDGHMTQGIDVHIEDLKKMFVYAPDTRITEHPIRIASGKYTAVTGVFQGTFTRPMPLGGGKFLPPTNKAFKLSMATIGIWENGVMTEEHLFWDNQTFMTQLGLSK